MSRSLVAPTRRFLPFPLVFPAHPWPMQKPLKRAKSPASASKNKAGVGVKKDISKKQDHSRKSREALTKKGRRHFTPKTEQAAQRARGFETKEAKEVTKLINKRNEQSLAGKASAAGGAFKMFKPE